MSCILYNYYLVWFALGLVWVVCSSGFVFCWLLAFGLWGCGVCGWVPGFSGLLWFYCLVGGWCFVG